jgi:hypothetical protein
MAKIATKKKQSREPQVERPFLTVTTKTEKEDVWSVDEVSENYSLGDIQKGLAAGIYFILTTDSDKDKAVVMSAVINSRPYVLARLTHDGRSSGCDIKYKAGL